jgi:hypothetical protein
VIRTLKKVEPTTNVIGFENNPFGPASLRYLNLECEVVSPFSATESTTEIRYDERFDLRLTLLATMTHKHFLDSVEIQLQLAGQQPTNIVCMVTAQQENSKQSTRLELMPFKKPVLVGSCSKADYVTGVISNGPDLLIPRFTDGDTTKEKPARLTNDAWEIDIHNFSHTSQLFRDKRANAGRHAASHWFAARPLRDGIISA